MPLPGRDEGEVLTVFGDEEGDLVGIAAAAARPALDEVQVAHGSHHRPPGPSGPSGMGGLGRAG